MKDLIIKFIIDEKSKLIIDLDNTITIDFKNHNYPEKILNEDVKKAMKKRVVSMKL